METCPLCRSIGKCVRTANAVDYSAYSCDCCGQFMLSYRTEPFMTEEDRFRCACLSTERKIHYGQDSMVNLTTKENLDDFLRTYPSEPLILLERVLLNLSRIIDYPGQMIEIAEIPHGPELLTKFDGIPFKYLFFAKNFFLPRDKETNPEDYRCLGFDLTEILDGIGWTNTLQKKKAFNDYPFTCHIKITHKGWETIRELRNKPNRDLKQGFVAMAFDPAMNPFYENIKHGIEGAGYVARRVDKQEHNDKICDRIIADIRQSRFLVADLTGNNNGVYFEAGFAFGLNLPVIYICHKPYFVEHGTHFDINHYNTIVYENGSDLETCLTARIQATIPNL